jgi:hypothetical protein
MTWSEPSDDGGAPILDYAIWSDQAIGEDIMIA